MEIIKMKYWLLVVGILLVSLEGWGQTTTNYTSLGWDKGNVTPSYCTEPSFFVNTSATPNVGYQCVNHGFVALSGGASPSGVVGDVQVNNGSGGLGTGGMNCVAGTCTMGSTVLPAGVPYSIAAYGAVGDDTTDDTTAINNAIAAAMTAGGGVCSPAGKIYLMNGQVLLPNDGATPAPMQKPLTLTTCGDGSTQWQRDPSGGGTPQNGMATWDMRWNAGNGGKITSLGAGALKISGLALVDNGTPTSYSVNGATLTNIVVTSNVGVATFASAPSGGTFVGASWAIAGSTTTVLNGKVKVTAASGATITFTTSGVSNGTYNNGVLTMSYSAPFIYLTNTTPTIRDVFIRGNATLTQNGIVFGGMGGGGAANGTINSGYQGYGGVVDHAVFAWLGTPIVLQQWANNNFIIGSSWVHNTGVQAIECDGRTSSGVGPLQNYFIGDTIEMDTYKYAVTLDACPKNTWQLNLEDTGAGVTSIFFYGSNGTSQNNSFTFVGADSKTVATGNSTNGANNQYTASDGSKAAVLGTVPTGTLGMQLPYGLLVDSTFPKVGASGVVPGGIMTWDPTDTSKYIAMGYDVSDDRGIIDVYNFSAAAPRIALLQPSGGRLEIGSSLVGVSTAPVVVGTGCTATIGTGSTNLAGTITLTGTPGACSVAVSWWLPNTYGSNPAHGFGCHFQDTTTPASIFTMSAWTTTTTTFGGTFANNDVIFYSGCTGF